MVEVLRLYANRADLLEALRLVAEVLDDPDSAQPVGPANSNRPQKSRRIADRLTDDDVRAIVEGFKAGTTRDTLAKQYGILHPYCCPPVATGPEATQRVLTTPHKNDRKYNACSRFILFYKQCTRQPH